MASERVLETLLKFKVDKASFSAAQNIIKELGGNIEIRVQGRGGSDLRQSIAGVKTETQSISQEVAEIASGFDKAAQSARFTAEQTQQIAKAFLTKNVPGKYEYTPDVEQSRQIVDQLTEAEIAALGFGRAAKTASEQATRGAKQTTQAISEETKAFRNMIAVFERAGSATKIAQDLRGGLSGKIQSELGARLTRAASYGQTGGLIGPPVQEQQKGNAQIAEEIRLRQKALEILEKKLAYQRQANQAQAQENNRIAELNQKVLQGTATADELREVIKASQGVSTEFENVHPRVVKVDRSLKSASQSASALGEAMRFGIAGFTTQILGVQIENAIKPLLLLPQRFATYAGMSNPIANQWLTASAEIEQSTMRIGQVLAREVLPFYEQIADIASGVAEYAEKNPEDVELLAKAAVHVFAIAQGLKLIGFALSAIGTFGNLKSLKLVAGVGQAGSSVLSTGLGTGAGVGGGLLAGTSLSAILPVIVTAVVAYLALKNIDAPFQDDKPPEERLSLTEAARQSANQGFGIIASGGGALGKIIKNLYEGRPIFEDIAQGMAIAALAGEKFAASLWAVEERLGRAGRAGEKSIESDAIVVPANITEGIARVLQQISDLETQYAEDRAKAIEDGQQQILELEQEYSKRRAELVSDYAKQLIDLTQDYNKRVADITTDFTQSEKRADEDHYRKRTKTIEEHYEEVERAQEDHEKRLENLRKDHEQRVEDLVSARDALGLAREMRRYQDEKAREEEEFADEQRRREEDFEERISEMDEEYAIAKARRREDFEERLAEAEAQFLEEKAKIAQQFQEKLNELDRQHADEKSKLKKAIEEQLKLIDQRYAKERENMEKAIADQVLLAEALGLSAQNIQAIYDQGILAAQRIAELRNQVLSQLFGNSLPSLPSTPGGGGGGGGGSPASVYQVAEGLGGATSFEGGSLRQLGRGQNVNIVVTQQDFRFDGSLGAEERGELREMMVEVVYDAFDKIYQG